MKPQRLLNPERKKNSSVEFTRGGVEVGWTDKEDAGRGEVVGMDEMDEGENAVRGRYGGEGYG